MTPLILNHCVLACNKDLGGSRSASSASLFCPFVAILDSLSIGAVASTIFNEYEEITTSNTFRVIIDARLLGWLKWYWDLFYLLFSCCLRYLWNVLLFLSGNAFTAFWSSADNLADSAGDGCGSLTNSPFWPHFAQEPDSSTQGMHKIWYADFTRFSKHFVHFVGCVNGLYLPYL